MAKNLDELRTENPELAEALMAEANAAVSAGADGGGTPAPQPQPQAKKKRRGFWPFGRK